MDKSQYQPPRTEYSAELYEQIEKSAVQHTPERYQQAPFQFVKDIEALVDSFRETAEGIEQRKGRETKMKFLPLTFVLPARKHEEIRRELIDTERRIGGQLFAEKNKYYFWYGEKGESAIRTEGVADWYIEEIVPGKPGGGVITHIETHPQYIKKFNHNGQLVPVTLSDLEVFIPAAYHYVYAIMDAYPFDRDRAELILEEMDMPNDVSALLPPVHGENRKSDHRNDYKSDVDLAA